MQAESSRNKRVLKNTLFLYGRMIIVTVVSFFTARLTLQILGVEDYGILNVVTMLISFMSILTATMTSATQRFLAFYLGKNDIPQYQKIFSITLQIYAIFAIIILILTELLGGWIIDDWLVIPPERQHAAYWAYQFSIMSFLASMMLVPFMSSIVAYEKMDVFGYLGIADSLIKLGIVYLLYISTADKLVTLSCLNAIAQVFMLFIYAIYCIRSFEGCRLKFMWDKNTTVQLMSYTGWNFFGAVSGVLSTSGISVVLNLFFGPVVNAAKAIADKVNQLIVQLSSNFYQASSPVIIKSYAAGEQDYSRKLACKCSKLAYFLVYIISLPVILTMEELLSLWLGKDYVTPDMIIFSQWMLIYSLVNVLEMPLTLLIRATGDIKNYQICVGIITLCVVPVCYVLFKFGLPAYFSIIALTVIYAIAHFVRMSIVQKEVHLKMRHYTKEVLCPILYVTLPTVIPMYMLTRQFPPGFLRVIIIGGLSLCVTAMLICLLGLTHGERKYVIRKASTFFRKIF